MQSTLYEENSPQFVVYSLTFWLLSVGTQSEIFCNPLQIDIDFKALFSPRKLYSKTIIRQATMGVQIYG